MLLEPLIQVNSWLKTGGNTYGTVVYNMEVTYLFLFQKDRHFKESTVFHFFFPQEKNLSGNFKKTSLRFKKISVRRHNVNIIKWPYYPRQSRESMHSLSQYQWHFLQNKKRIILKFVWKHRRPWLAKTVLGKNWAGGKV